MRQQGELGAAAPELAKQVQQHREGDDAGLGDAGSLRSRHVIKDHTRVWIMEIKHVYKWPGSLIVDLWS